MKPKFAVASILLLLLCSEVLSYRLQKREAENQNVFTQIQETAKGYINYISDATHAWVDKVKSLDISQRIWNTYSDISTTVSTYREIVTDQMYHWWQDQ